MNETSKHNIERRRKETAEKWRCYNRREERNLATFIVGWMAVVVFLAVVLAQVAIRKGWLR